MRVFALPRVIVIPTDGTQPIFIKKIRPADPDEYRSLLQGSAQIVGIERPDAAMFVNEDGKALGLPINSRATAVLWAHNRAFRGADILCGDVFVAGPPRNGTDIDAPDRLVQLLTKPGTFKTEVQVNNEDGWHGNQKVFGEVWDAYAYGLELAERWRKVRDIRVVPAGD